MDEKLYRIWYGWSDAGGGDRREISRVRAYNIDDVITLVKTEIIAEGVAFSEDGDDYQLYLILDSCFGCDLKYTDRDMCDDCERGEYVEIEEDNDAEPSFNLITGENLFYDLTIPECFLFDSIIQSVDGALVEFTLSKTRDKKC